MHTDMDVDVDNSRNHYSSHRKQRGGRMDMDVDTVVGNRVDHCPDDNDLRLSAAWDWRASHQVPLGQDRYWAMVRLQDAVFKRQPR